MMRITRVQYKKIFAIFSFLLILLSVECSPVPLFKWGNSFDGLVVSYNSEEYVSGNRLNLGTQVAGDSKTITVTLVNRSTNTVNLTGSPVVSIGGANSALFTILAQPTNTSLAPNANVAFKLVYTPGASNYGAHNATLSILSDQPDVPKFSLLLMGTGTSSKLPMIQVKDENSPIDIAAYFTGSTAVPSIAAFGAVQSTTSSAKTLTVRNIGQNTLKIGTVSFTGTAFTGTIKKSSLGANESTDLTVIFSPTAASTYTETLTITSNDALSGNLTSSKFVFTLKGTGLASSSPKVQVTSDGIDLTASGLSVNFVGTKTTESFTKAFILRNVGTTDLVLGSNPVSIDNSTDFTVFQPTNLTIKPDQAVAFNVIFHPNSASSISTTLRIQSVTDGEIDVTLNGIGGTNVAVTWPALKQGAVNSLGGGYKVCYAGSATGSGFTFTSLTNGNADGCNIVNYNGGAYTANQTVFTLSSGTYYFKVLPFTKFGFAVITETASAPGSITF
ncbi:choice-of-anchor D domain-containing protein [Leptospira langatensis]|uniref:Choice-of-anchor D domain-containing protein n=1 Tax=Leptospira langatensis TaxID=2484983 RepID=A0A5F1ZZ94_9LEPT|nr:choice-of-anchor D domain-containing protein [Leptospira langatensis]TGJ98412.1 choice-of-anchor D domain-containing protein [Leptospira langatensis]TGL43327.1 choice-of-anchor D domain-containing protein [Leptospira langatensis]